MFVREKRINGYTYLYLVETVREDGRAKQRIIKNLGRKEAVTASGALERLASSVARYAERAVVLSQIEAGNPAGLACTRIGAPLLFGRLWEETGCRAVIADLLAERRLEFRAGRGCACTTSIVPWPGWARSSRPTSRAVPHPLPPARSRTSSRSSCSRAGATCLANSPWCFSTRPRCRSPVRVGRPWASGATPRTIAPT